MSIETIQNLGGAQIEGIKTLDDAANRAKPAAEASNGASFAETLGQAIESVDKVQLEADAQANKVATGGGNLHEMSLALEKADVSMRLAMKVRNKIVDAYQEIMRMGV